MRKPLKTRFPLKIIASYLVLATLAVIVVVFLFSEMRTYLNAANDLDSKKAVETGSLINLVYETDSYSRLALLSENEEDFERFQDRVDSLYQRIADFRKSTTKESQRQQLDSIKRLIISKNKNIIALRKLSMEMQEDNSLDEILREISNLEDNMGKLTMQNTLNPKWRSRKERKTWENIITMLNYNKGIDTMKVPAKVVDSTLAATRYIVAEAKYIKNKNREELKSREAELIMNDLVISKELQELISVFDQQISRNYLREKTVQQRSIEKASSVLKISGIVGLAVILLFSYIIISDFFRAEKLRRKLRVAKETTEDVLKSREQLIATVSHDLKTPLHTISGYTELFKNTALTEKQKYYSSQIASGSLFITQLVNDLLDFSKLEAGKLKIDHVAFDLENILLESGNAVKDRYPDKPVKLHFKIDEKLTSRYYKSDPLRIRQIVLNLVSNAFKFTDEGSVSIIAEIIAETDQKTTVKITVKDTGIGISAEKQELIFKEFTQAEEDTSRKFGGTGLGLAISKKLAGLLGGSISVVSELGEGSNFSVEIPLEKVSGIEIPVAKVAPDPSENTKLKAKMLKAIVFDDDPAMRSLLTEVLEQEGISCNAFEKFSDFEAISGAVDYDFVLTDIQMPETDGFEVLKKLKNGTFLHYKKQPIVAMTGNQQHKTDYYFEQGFSELLHKPFHKIELLNVIHSLFGTGEEYTTVTEEPNQTNAPYDLSLLRSFVRDEKGLKEILSVFLKQTKVDMQVLRKAVEENDLDTIRALSHRKLTMARQIKAHEIVTLLEALETIEDNSGELEKLFKNFDVAMEKIAKALENEIS
ncbi:hybrid sensor histidine kinase/response regulator [Marinirhabdus gelatinilytica]|uniref:histidine kinase n=1 Tax=Marinirhabdus gelatinilytica TaxID=1703343 RepID=A0A370QKA5_9FLAO|nr:ATP-binding protein [Marinirhabdus gelatinilytica]RDK88805.1 signal transduction histidine kinase [Marinirhabdus gelatinilytica]